MGPLSPLQASSRLPLPVHALPCPPRTVRLSRQPPLLARWREEDAGLQLPPLGCPCAVVCQLCAPIAMNATIWYATWTS